MSEQLTSEDLLSRLKEQIHQRRENPSGSFITLTANEMNALVECAEALKELSGMYASTWDRVDGALLMTDSGVTRFESAHQKARNAINKLEGL